MSIAAPTAAGPVPAAPSASGAPAPPPHSAWADFRLGLTSPSAWALLGSLLVAAAWSAWLVRLVTPAWVASPAGYRLASDGQDRMQRVTSLALEVSLAGRLEGPAVFLFGASDFREGLISEEGLAGLLPSGTRVYDFYSGWQSLLDTAALVEKLPAHPRGVSVVMVSPKRIAHGITYEFDYGQQPPFYRNYGFRSEVREEIAAREGVETSFRSSSLLLDNYHFYLPRVGALLRNSLSKPPSIANHQWTEVTGKPLTPEEHARQSAELSRVLVRYADQRADSFWMLGRICDMLRERGGRVVLLEAPMSPHGLEVVVGLELLARYRAELAAFAGERNLPYWDLNPELALADEDFWDDQHIWSKGGRARFSYALAQRLVQLLEARGGAQ